MIMKSVRENYAAKEDIKKPKGAKSKLQPITTDLFQNTKIQNQNKQSKNIILLKFRENIKYLGVRVSADE